MNTALKKVFLLILWMGALQNYLSAQDKFDIKFGKVSPADFDLSRYKFDTSAGAVYIADIGSTDFEEDKTWYKVVLKRQTRIKIINKNGFDAATFSIPVYKVGDVEQKLTKLQAVTYNLENGTVKSMKLDVNTVFSEKMDKYWGWKKFTMPAVTEGSIIEISYTLSSGHIDGLFPWDFQGVYPRIWSEYQAKIPAFFDYIFLTQGYHPFHINTQTVSKKTFMLIEDQGTVGAKATTIDAPVVNARWVMKDVPPLKAEPFVTTLKNYISRIQFQCAELKEPYTPQNIMGNWNSFCTTLLKRDDFGGAVNSYAGWLTDEMKNLGSNTSSSWQKAVKVYEYVQKNFVCKDYNDFSASVTPASLIKNKSGSVGDINLLLIALLKNNGIPAEPVLLSTREHGFVNADYPLQDRFNYVIARAVVNGKTVFLDATEPKLGFGRLPQRCYNGHARVINAQSPEAVYLNADTLRESQITSVFLSNADDGKLVGTCASKLGYYASLQTRQTLTKGNEELLKLISKEYPEGVTISALEIDSAANHDQPVHIRYNIDVEAFDADVVYFSPLMGEHDVNAFKSAQRLYPVEMDYVQDETYILSIEIPKGYTVDELPQSVKIKLNQDDGLFEYLISKSETTINLRTRTMFNRANFGPEEYNTLRDFFAQIVKKHGEQIVFKKKK